MVSGELYPVTIFVGKRRTHGERLEAFYLSLSIPECVSPFSLSGGSSLYYTSNVGLTRRDALEDIFAVVNAAGTWTRRLHPEVELQIGLQASMFRYHRESQLDFNDLGAGFGLSWTPQSWSGVGIFARYDFTELIDRHGNEILRDHQFSLGGQKVFVLGRAHAFSLGALGSVGISTPVAAQSTRRPIGFKL